MTKYRIGSAMLVMAGIILSLAGPTTADSDSPDMRWLNPAGQEPAEIVLEVMKKYGIEHGPLAFVDKGAWLHASETSAVVAVETTRRAATVLSFGPTATYGKTLRGDGIHYIHVFYLKDLKPDTTYHYRVSGVTRTASKAATKDATFTTRTIPGAVRIPQDMQGPPYKLDKANTYYLLTEDIKAAKSAFEISAPGVTLDLGGHTVVYNEEHLGLATNSYNMMLKESSFGVRARGRDLKNLRILNGTIRQGKGNDEASYTTLGFNPVYMAGSAGSEIAGLTCIYAGKQMSGIVLHNGGAGIKFHHNVVEDLGRLIANRHKGCSAICFPSEGGKCYNNLVKRTRQVGIGHTSKSNIESYGNEVHIDSTSINAGGVGSGPDGHVHDNKIFGCGNNVVALGTTGRSAKNVKLYNNYIWLHACDISNLARYQRLGARTHEATSTSTMSGARITWGCNNVDYYSNTFLITGRENGKIRATFFYADARAKGAVFRDNLAITLAEDDKTTGWGTIGGVGNPRTNAVPIIFKNNTIVSNFRNVSTRDTYGCAKNYQFIGNKFVRVGQRSGYETLGGFRGGGGSGFVFLDSTFDGGAGYDKIGRIGDRYVIQWTLDLSAPTGGSVSITDKAGKVVFTGSVGPDGALSVPLTQYTCKGKNRTEMTPHAVSITAGGKTQTKSVTMDAKKTLEIGL